MLPFPVDAMIRGRMGSPGSAQVQLTHNTSAGNLKPQLLSVDHIAHSGLRGHNSTSLLELDSMFGCACHFSGDCSCTGTMAFMACIKDQCGTGACRCSAPDFMKACDSVAATCPASRISCQASPAVPPDAPTHYRAQCVTVPGPTDRPTTSHIIAGTTTTADPADCADGADAKERKRRRRRPKREQTTTIAAGRERSKDITDLPEEMEDRFDELQAGETTLAVEWPMPWFGAPQGPWVDGNDRKNGPVAGRF